MRPRFHLQSLVLFFCLLSCVDRIHFDVPGQLKYPVAIEGFISNQPGPYEINVTNSFDIDSDQATKTPASVKKMTILDDIGNSEILTEHATGNYKTDPSGIRGVIGRVYRLRVELLNGDVFESTPDTLREPGSLDSVYTRFEIVNSGGPPKYAFRVLFNSTNEGTSSRCFQWTFTATYKVNTVPEADREGEACGTPLDCEKCSICNLVWKCSGIRNVGTPKDPVFVRMFPCTCCTCWYSIYNELPIMASLDGLKGIHMRGALAGSVAVDDIIFQNKVIVEVQQQSISDNTYRFYRGINIQHDAVNSLFQPVSGKLPGNFVQEKDGVPPVLGVFYAAGVARKILTINRNDIPFGTYVLLPEFPPPVVGANCHNLRPHSTNERPAIWED